MLHQAYRYGLNPAYDAEAVSFDPTYAIPQYTWAEFSDIHEDKFGGYGGKQKVPRCRCHRWISISVISTRQHTGCLSDGCF